MRTSTAHHVSSRFIISVVAATFIIALAGAQSTFAADRTAHQALNSILPDANFTGVTLGDALDFLHDVSDINLHVNWSALEAAGVSKDTPISVHLRSAAVRKVLDLMLAESSPASPLTYYVDADVVEITTRELADKMMVTRVYPVEDLIVEIPDFTDAPNFNLQSSSGGSGSSGGNSSGSSLLGSKSSGSAGNQQTLSRAQRAQALIDSIVAVIRPEVWQVNGGQSTIRFFNGMLIITAPRSVHEALAEQDD